MMDPVIFTVAGLLAGVQAKTGNYTTVAADDGNLIDVDTSAGSVTITLLAAATGGAGYRLGVRKSTTDANTVTISGPTVGTTVLGSQNDTVLVVSNGTTYYALNIRGDLDQAQSRMFAQMYAGQAMAAHEMALNPHRRYVTFDQDAITARVEALRAMAEHEMRPIPHPRNITSDQAYLTAFAMT
jgi:hypothetical protein